MEKCLKRIKAITETVDNREYEIRGTYDVLQFLKDFELLDYLTEENAFVVCLNTKNKVVGYSQVAKGGVNYVNIDMKSIFKIALLTNAEKIIFIHNHPSGDTTPSKNDLEFAENLRNCCNLMGVCLLDNVIVANDNIKTLMKF